MGNWVIYTCSAPPVQPCCNRHRLYLCKQILRYFTSWKSVEQFYHPLIMMHAISPLNNILYKLLNVEHLKCLVSAFSLSKLHYNKCTMHV